MADKLLIVDCDGVLYHPSELDINAMVYAFNEVCDDFGLKDEKFNYIENCTRDKPIRGFYNYIASVAQKVDVPTEDFILKMVDHIDYSGIKADSDGILQKLSKLSRKCQICICTNNHLAHLNHVLKAKFNIEAKDLFLYDNSFWYSTGKTKSKAYRAYFWFEDTLASYGTGGNARLRIVFNEATGVAEWHITSLDPMTMEPTDDPMEGVLPVNDGGNGIGEINFDISLLPTLDHGTEVNNQANIVFDKNDAILTPVWTNVIDRISPVSRLVNLEQLNDSIASVSIEASDELSGTWRYDVYVQYGTDAPWWKAAEGIPVDSVAKVKLYDGINHGFYVTAIDMAGNVEQKEQVREFTLNVPIKAIPGDVNNDRMVDTQDAIKVIQHYLNKNPEGFKVEQADVTKDGVVDTQDAIQIIKSYLKK